MQHPKWISAVDLNRWADNADARNRFPELIRRLIHVSIPKADLSLIDFLGGEESHRPGLDGRTQAKSGSSKVPSGSSYWELGTDKAVREKLEGDFDKRARANLETRNTSYVAATPRDFQKKNEWAESKRKLGLWRDVRVYDSNDLEQWLEESPSVALWLMRVMGRSASGLSDVSSHWENLQASLKCGLPPQALLVSRTPTVEAIKTWLNQEPGVLSIRAESPQEVIDVFAAWVASLSGEEQAAVASRAIIVEHPDSWRQLLDTGQDLILIRAEQLELSQELLAEAARKGNFVLSPLSSLSPESNLTHKLERMNRDELKEILRAAGLSEHEAHASAQHSGGSFSILKRQMSTAPNIRAPQWASGGVATDLAPLLLVGAWKDSAAADQEIVQKVAARPYPEVLGTLNTWRERADAPVRWANGEWEFVSPQDAWTFLAKALTPAQLSAFEDAAASVLGTDDPRLDLAREDRWMAGVHGKRLAHSEALRRGLSQTLALLATRESNQQVADMVPLHARVSRTVRTILTKESSWRRWASLGHLLPTLAEAAPEMFLDAVEADLGSADPQLTRLFAEEGDNFTGRAEHTGLLWALERVAWAPAYLSRAAIVLARLAERDPGGKWANRPSASLRDTFCPWLPHTAASPDQQVEVVGLLLERFPKVGWQLLLKLLPEQLAAISSRSLPEWRYWAEKWRRGVTRGDFTRVTIAYMNKAISACEREPEKWLDIFDHFANYPTAELDRAISAMAATAKRNLADDLRLKIWLGLREEIQRHKYFKNAKWAIKPPVLARLEAIAELFKPDDPVERALPLFKEGLDRVGDESMSWSEQEALTQQRRAECIKDLLQHHGFESVKRLARSSGEPWAVGVGLVDVAVDKFDSEVLPALLDCGDTRLEGFARGYAGRRVSIGGWDWIKQLPLGTWNPKQAATVLEFLPHERSTWNFVADRGSLIEAEYWRMARPYVQGEANDVEYVVRKLISVGRAASALDVLGMATTRKVSFPGPKLLELFESTLQTLSTERRPMHASMVEDVFAELQKSTDVDASRMASLEWLLLPALRGQMAPRALERALSQQPAFFVDMLVLHFRPKHRDKSKDAELPKDKKDQAQRAAILLGDWKRLPGTRDDGSVDPAALLLWVREARKRAKEADRIEVCDIMLGKVFAYAPEDPDGSWPCLAVRELLEEANSVDLEQGLGTGIVNKRGIYSKSPTDGGRQERALAERYEAYALKAQTRWPRTAAVLRRIVTDYKEQARREDAEVEAEG